MTADSQEDRDRRWWRSGIPEEDRYIRVDRTAKQMRRQLAWRKDADMRRLRMYGANTNVFAAGATRPILGGGGRRLGANVIKSVSDTKVATVTKDAPKISFVTEGGDWQLQENAEGLEAFVEGQFYEMDLHMKSLQVALDGLGIFGSGFFYLAISGKKKNARIVAERVFPIELLYDENEWRLGEGAPGNQLGRDKWIDRTVLEELYRDDPAKLDAIEKCKTQVDDHAHTLGYDPVCDQLLVTELWHRKSGPDAKDGLFVRCIPTATLDCEEWDYDWLPFFDYSGQAPPVGLIGQGIAETQESTQTEINALLMASSQGLRLLGKGHVVANKASKVNFEKWDNETGSLIEYQGDVSMKPDIYVPQYVVPPETYQQIETLIQRAHWLEGASLAQAQGQTEAPEASGKSKEVELSVTDRRTGIAIKRFHHLFLRMAKAILDLARTIVKDENPDFGSLAMDRHGEFRKVVLSKIDLAPGEYRMKLWETNWLSDDPSKRMADVERMANAGWVAPDQAKRMLKMPDLQENQSLEDASYDAVEQCISDMLRRGVYRAPIPFLNLEQAKRQVLLATVRAWREGRPEKNQQLLRDFYQDLLDIQTPSPQPAAPQVMASAPGTPVMGGGGAGAPQVQMQAPPGAPPPSAAPPVAA